MGDEKIEKFGDDEYTSIPIKVGTKKELAEFCGKLRTYDEAIAALLKANQNATEGK